MAARPPRALKPSVLKQYGHELAQAEQMAAKGIINGRLNEEVYGSTEPFNPLEELQVLQQNNIIDKQWMEETMTELEKPKTEALDTPVPANEAPPVEAAPEVAPVVEQPGLSSDPEVRLKQIAESLAKDFPGSPTEKNLRDWKNIHGSVFILPLEEKIFIYRYLKRQEWVQINSSDDFSKMRPDQQDDFLFNRCILWPRLNPMQIAALPANAVGMIAEQIKLQSLFLDPVQVANITIKI